MPISELKEIYGNHDRSLQFRRDLFLKLLDPDNPLSTEECECVVELLVVGVTANWEESTNGLLVACLRHDPSLMHGYALGPESEPPSVETCAAYIMEIPQKGKRGLPEAPKRRYLSFRNTEALINFSRPILPDASNPFLALRDYANEIDDFYLIRNYVTHRSQYAKDFLLKIYESKYGHQGWVEPGRALLADGGKLFSAYFDVFAEASHRMRAQHQE